jgi:hypothetical protein
VVGNCCAASSSVPQAPSVMACPVCGNRSRQVGAITVRSLVRRLPFGMPSAQYYFCLARTCRVVYFSPTSGAPTFREDDLLVRLGQKDEQSGLVCYCFGLTRNDITEEVQQTGKSIVTERVKAEIRAGHCACELKNPSGKCCLGDLTRVVQEALRRAAGNRNSTG